MLADSEVGRAPALDFDRDARLWVQARARLAMPDREGTEATYLDPTAPRKCFADHLKMVSTMRSTSLCWRCGCSSAILRTSFDFVIAVPRGPSVNPAKVRE